MENLWHIAMEALGFWNLFTFFLMAWDKGQSKRKGWRIPEKTLIVLNFLGGGLGLFLGSRAFRHKTKKKPFPYLLPLGAIITLGIGALLLWG